jgi:hypothetical protein
MAQTTQGQSQGKKEGKKEREGLTAEEKEAIMHNAKQGLEGITAGMGLTPGLAAADVKESSAVFGLIN